MTATGNATGFKGWRWLWLPAGLLILLAWQAVRIVPARHTRIARRRETWNRLAELKQESATWREAPRQYRRRYPAGDPEPWEKLAGDPPPKATVELLPLQERTLPDGARWLQQAIEFQDVGIETVANWMYRAETGSPPWRLVSVTLEAGGERGLIARGSLRFESLAHPQDTNGETP